MPHDVQSFSLTRGPGCHHIIDRNRHRQALKVAKRLGLQSPFAGHDTHSLPLPEARELQFARLRDGKMALVPDHHDFLVLNL